MGSSLKTVALAAAVTAVFAPQISKAADLPAPLPAPVIEEFGGWYLRGDIGMTNQKAKGIQHPQMSAPDNFQWLDRGGFDSSPLFGLGIGYKHNNWFRWDLTGEYRGKAGFSALDRYETVDDGNAATWDATNDYRAKKSEWLFMLNAYVDLGTWRAVTPFVGAGIGLSRNTISNFRDINTVTAGVAYAPEGSKWDFAWALHAGLTYDVTPNFAIELSYRYLSLGDGKTGNLTNYLAGCVSCAPMTFKEITSHDLKLGVRWMFADAGYMDYQPPLIRKY
jgi:opacity protein-like surface antigen